MNEFPFLALSCCLLRNICQLLKQLEAHCILVEFGVVIQGCIYMHVVLCHTNVYYKHFPLVFLFGYFLIPFLFD